MSHPVDIHVGKRLRMRRTLLGMSQETLGSMVGVTFQQIQKYERGINRIGSSRLYEFSRSLTVPIAFFFEGFNALSTPAAQAAGFAEPEATEFEAEPVMSRESIELMRHYGKITDPQLRKRVLDLVKALSQEVRIETTKASA